jgi:predicted nucleotidyltransferase
LANDITHLPEQKRKLLEALVEFLSKITDLSAVVLGGSYASKTHHTESDMDFGI